MEKANIISLKIKISFFNDCQYPKSYKIERIINFDPSFTTYVGFDWSRVSIPHTSYYGTMFWIWAEKSVDNSGMF